MTRIALGGLLVALLLSGCGGASVVTPVPNYTPPAIESIPGAEGQENAASVNGVNITVEDFRRELARHEAGQVALGLQSSNPALYQQNVLDRLIDDELFRQEAARQGIEVTEAEVQVEIAKDIELFGEDYFDSWLIANFWSREEYEEYIRTFLLTQQVIAPIQQNMTGTAEQVRARHILVNSPEDAQAIINELAAGTSFEDLARENSLDVTSRTQGGDLGWFPRGVLLVTEVEDAAFALDPGQVSGVVSSPWGYHVVQTLEYDPARELDAGTRNLLYSNTVSEYIDTLRANATIEQYILNTDA